MVRGVKNLDYRWDVALTKLGCDVEDFEIKGMAYEEIFLPLFQNGVIIDVFDLAYINSSIHRKSVYVRDSTMHDEIKTLFSDFYGNRFKIELIINEEYFSDKTKIKKLKYKGFEIKVYCPISYSQIEQYRNNWFKKL
jgi:hypothetical protein